jgi:hypothetical protein
VKVTNDGPTDDGLAVQATRCDAPADPMSAGALSGLDSEHSASSDSQEGWLSSTITAWDQLTTVDRRAEKIRAWRRRALLKRGARLHTMMMTAMGTNARSCSLAMLDEVGVVVSWYGRADGDDQPSEDVVNRHVSLFYVSEEVARHQPHRDLRAAVLEGRTTRSAWRRRPDGSAFWGTIVIEPLVLRDGRVQGFSYVTSVDPNRHNGR